MNATPTPQSQLTEAELDLLEPLLRDWVGLIGLPATMVIVERWGGTRLSIAERAGENAELAAAIGQDKADILGRHYGCERPLVPKALPALHAVRNRRIRAELCSLSVRQVAMKYRLGERRIFQLLEEKGRTPDMFD